MLKKHTLGSDLDLRLEQENDHTSCPYRLTTFFFIFLLVLTGIRSAKAEYYEIIPSANLTQEYNDNIFVSETAVNDFITSVASDLAVLGMDERLDWNLSGGVRFREYAENKLQNQQDWHAKIGLNYRHTERSSIYTDVSFITDTRPDTIENGFVTRSADRERYMFNIGGRHAASETSSPFFTYSYVQEDFKFFPERNQRTNILAIGVSHRLDRILPMTTGQMFVNYSHSDYATSDDDTVRFLLGVEKTWSERWRFNANAGIRYTKSTFVTLTPNATPPPTAFTGEGVSDDWGPATDIALSYDGEYTRIALTAGRDVVPGSGQGRSLEQVRWTGNVNHRFSDNLRGNLNASIQSQQSFRDINPALRVDRWSFLFSPSISHDFTRHWSIECVYRFFFLDDRRGNQEAIQNIFAVTLSFRYPFIK